MKSEYSNIKEPKTALSSVLIRGNGSSAAQLIQFCRRLRVPNPIMSEKPRPADSGAPGQHRLNLTAASRRNREVRNFVRPLSIAFRPVFESFRHPHPATPINHNRWEVEGLHLYPPR